MRTAVLDTNRGGITRGRSSGHPLDGMNEGRSDNVIRYARTAVFLPLLVPGLFYLLHLLALADRGFLLGGLVGSIVIGGIPYAAVAIIALAYLWNRPLADCMRWALRAPIVFMPVLVAFLVWSQLLGRVQSLLEFGDILLITAPAVLIIGYAYVGLFYVGVRVLSRGATKSVASDA
jgi:hypothetical protein